VGTVGKLLVKGVAFFTAGVPRHLWVNKAYRAAWHHVMDFPDPVLHLVVGNLKPRPPDAPFLLQKRMKGDCRQRFPKTRPKRRYAFALTIEMMNRLPLMGLERLGVVQPSLKVDGIGFYRNADLGVEYSVVFVFKLLAIGRMIGDIIFEAVIVFAVEGLGVVVPAPLFLHVEVVDDLVGVFLPLSLMHFPIGSRAWLVDGTVPVVTDAPFSGVVL